MRTTMKSEWLGVIAKYEEDEDDDDNDNHMKKMPDRASNALK